MNRNEPINIYVKLTKDFNQGKLRVIISSGQKEINDKDLFLAHKIIVQRALDVLPFSPPGDINNR